MEWDGLLSLIEHRLGMYVGRSRYDRAFSVVTGFDLARGQGALARFQSWMSDRHPGSAFGWSTLVLKEAFGDRGGENSLRTDRDHQLAVETLCRRLREFFDR